MNKTQAGRLLTLAWFLRTEVPEEHFDMNVVICRSSSSGGWIVSDYQVAKVLENPSCGTSACARGWAAYLFDDLRAPNFIGDKFDHDYFGLDGQREWARLFSVANRTPKQEAKLIEDFVRSKGWEYA